MNNVDKIYELIMKYDGGLSGSCWEDLRFSHTATPKDIVECMISTYMKNPIFGIGNVTKIDKKLALAKYLRYVADDLSIEDSLNVKENNIVMQIENDKIISCLKYLPFHISSIISSGESEALKYDIKAHTSDIAANKSHGINTISIKFSKDELIENKQKEDAFGQKHKYLLMIAKAIEKEYDKKLEILLQDDKYNDDSKETEAMIRTAIIIHTRISFLVEKLNNIKFDIK